MNFDEFYKRVQEYAGLESREDAVTATEATLETLGEAVHNTDRAHIAAQLPSELKAAILRRPSAKPYLLEEFYKRVAGRAGITYPHAVKRSRSVARVLGEAVAQGEIRDVLSHLPRQYDELFGREPASILSPTSLTIEEQGRLKQE